MPEKAPRKGKSREEVAAAYSSEPWWYDVRGFLILTFAYRGTLWQQVRFFGSNVRSWHLEIAIGTGTLFDIVRKWRRWKKLPPARVCGLDYAASMLAGARKRFAGLRDIELRLADVAELPFPDASFDSANMANAVHCFPDVDAAFRQTFRVLKPGGTLAANVLLYPSGPAPLRWIAERINQWGMRKGILVSPYRQDDIRQRLEAAGFLVEREEVHGNTYNVLGRKPS